MAKNATRSSAIPLSPPKGGAIVRMYRIGHGDCFLIAFAGKKAPVHVLIDCGYKPQSPKVIGTTPDEVVANIFAVTDGKIDVAVITHEHQDHVNAITKTRFKDFTIGKIWYAWTESKDDKLADQLRIAKGRKIKQLQAARMQLAAGEASRLVDQILALETGGEDENFNGMALAAAKEGEHGNKGAMNFLESLCDSSPECFFPHKHIATVPGAEHVRVFALGPPHSEKAIRDLEPVGEENFRHLAMGDGSGTADKAGSPFALRFGVAYGEPIADSQLNSWFTTQYGRKGDGVLLEQNEQVPDNADFRRIDHEWLAGAEQLALAIGDFTNNSSLVLAFELGKGGKVLLFTGDAQRGNWVSWADKSFKDGSGTIDVKELLSRTVLYKCGHHGSHNATLKGGENSDLPSLGWIGTGEHEGEFTAMITAVRKWALTQDPPWDHPLEAIRSELVEKAAGRLLQTDTDFDEKNRPDNASTSSWKAFQSRVTATKLYFDLRIDP